jgi:hypothetical protein
MTEKGYKTLDRIKLECKKIESCATGSDWFMAHCFPFMLEKLDEISRKLDKIKINKPKRKSSEWNIFVSKHMKGDMSMREVAELWNKRKRGRDYGRAK